MDTEERKPDKWIFTKSLLRQAEAFEEIRDDWIRILKESPTHTEAARMVMIINSKIDMLDSLLRDAYVFRGINDHEL